MMIRFSLMPRRLRAVAAYEAVSRPSKKRLDYKIIL